MIYNNYIRIAAVFWLILFRIEFCQMIRIILTLNLKYCLIFNFERQNLLDKSWSNHQVLRMGCCWLDFHFGRRITLENNEPNVKQYRHLNYNEFNQKTACKSLWKLRCDSFAARLQASKKIINLNLISPHVFGYWDSYDKSSTCR